MWIQEAQKMADKESALSKAYSNTKGLWNTRGFLRRVSILHGALLRRRI